ncbi:MAG: PAS domain-containing hybrid sensor histidine kinase/response regulator, partial [Alcaligenaceae bacterium]
GAVATTGEPANFESYASDFNRWFEVKAVRIKDPLDRQIAIFFNNITERKNAEDRLKKSEALARENIERVQLALAAGAIIGTWHWNVEADQFTVDEGFADAFGLGIDLERRGLRMAQLIEKVHPEDKGRVQAAIQEALTKGGNYAHQYRVQRAGGAYHWIEANGRVELSPQGKPVSFPGVLIDIQERRLLQEERDQHAHALRSLNETLEQRVAERSEKLMRAEELLHQSQKMEAVGQLTGGLAHDFNNLLAGIGGALHLLNGKLQRGQFEGLDRYVGIAQDATKRAASLTHRLLAFSRRQTLSPKPTDVNQLIGGMQDMLQRTIGPLVALELVLEPEVWPVLIDASQLENSLLNLCLNARDAMPSGGSLAIHTENMSFDAESALALDLQTGDYLRLSVIDSGTGMSSDIAEHVFEPFFTTKPMGQGTGLGLSMVHGFTKQSGGQVRIESSVGVGTAVRLYVPRHSAAASNEALTPGVASSVQAQEGQTVLVVDDEPSVRTLVAEVLNDLGYATLEAEDGVQ